jgi:NAD-dependent DNA ligase
VLEARGEVYMTHADFTALNTANIRTLRDIPQRLAGDPPPVQIGRAHV